MEDDGREQRRGRDNQSIGDGGRDGEGERE